MDISYSLGPRDQQCPSKNHLKKRPSTEIGCVTGGKWERNENQETESRFMVYNDGVFLISATFHHNKYDLVYLVTLNFG